MSDPHTPLVKEARRQALQKAINRVMSFQPEEAKKFLDEVHTYNQILKEREPFVVRRLTDPNFIVSALALGLSFIGLLMHLLRLR